MKKKEIIICSILIFIAACLFAAIIITDNISENNPAGSTDKVQMNVPTAGTDGNNTATAEPTVAPTPEPTPLPLIHATHVDESNPDKYGLSSNIRHNDDDISSYNREDKIFFDLGSDYNQINGIPTFRGNNYRNTAGAFGTINITEQKFSDDYLYTITTDHMMGKNNYWSGIGWSGQAVAAEWPKETRQIMGMYDWAKEQDTLVEVISASQDGCIYFYELETGKATRDKIDIGFPFKGGGALDPRGLPLLYVGSGDQLQDGSRPAAYIISLITNEKIYEFGKSDSFATRRTGWCAFDSSPIVDAETDTLIWPGENGVIYFVDLNTNYDKANGTISINPDIVKFNFDCDKHEKRGGRTSFWHGMENSVIAYQEYIYIADNAGILICLNVNTLEVEWVQDLLDDTNCTGVLEIEDGKPYIYMSTAYHYGWRSTNTTEEIPVWKINAENGEIVWRTDFMCKTTSSSSGGAQGSLALGEGQLDNMVFVPLCRTPDTWDGILVALNTKTGEVIWERKLNYYTWTSPSIIYDDDTGKGYIVTACATGYLYLIDGLTGEILDTKRLLEGTIEASPIVYNDVVILGTRDDKIHALRIK